MPTDICSHKQAETAMRIGYSAEATHALPLPLKRRGLRRAKALFCQAERSFVALTGDWAVIPMPTSDLKAVVLSPIFR